MFKKLSKKTWRYFATVFAISALLFYCIGLPIGLFILIYVLDLDFSFMEIIFTIIISSALYLLIVGRYYSAWVKSTFDSYQISKRIKRRFDPHLTSLARRLKLLVSAITQSVERGGRLKEEKPYHFP